MIAFVSFVQRSRKSRVVEMPTYQCFGIWHTAAVLISGVGRGPWAILQLHVQLATQPEQCNFDMGANNLGEC